MQSAICSLEPSDCNAHNFIKMSSNQEKVRELVLSTYLENPELKYSVIAKKTGASESTVKRVVSNYKKGVPTIRKKGSGRKAGAEGNLAKRVKEVFKQNPNTSVRDVGVKAGTSKSIVQRIKSDGKLKTYRVQS